MVTRIVVEHVRPPVPSRQFDWAAWEDGEEERGVVGRGPTRQAAIDELLELLEIDEYGNPVEGDRQIYCRSRGGGCGCMSPECMAEECHVHGLEIKGDTER